ncbi:MAG TPA: hypothetical protein VHB50_17375 [Bryobacteraceae bacterium]|nr:hypothetical protein [Bryobacteraceae bacterium]
MRNGYPILATVMPAALLVWGVYDVALAVPANSETDRIVDEMIHQQEVRFDRIGSFSRLQHYAVTTGRFGLKAELVARVHRDRRQGKTYEIISRSGSQVIQSHVFDPLLEAEVETSHHAPELLTREFYSFRLAGEATFGGHRCYLIETEPKQREKRLLKGKLWLNKDDYGIVHVEGKPTESLSFWVGKPMILQDFTKLGGYWWAARRHSYIDNMWLGKADLVIDYSDYQFEPRGAEDLTEAQAMAASTP